MGTTTIDKRNPPLPRGMLHPIERVQIERIFLPLRGGPTCFPALFFLPLLSNLLLEWELLEDGNEFERCLYHNFRTYKPSP